MKKRIVSLLLVLAMVLVLAPTVSNAAGVIDTILLNNFKEAQLGGSVSEYPGVSAPYGSQYTVARVHWYNSKTNAPVTGSFQAGNEYVCQIALEAKSGYTFDSDPFIAINDGNIGCDLFRSGPNPAGTTYYVWTFPAPAYQVISWISVYSFGDPEIGKTVGECTRAYTEDDADYKITSAYWYNETTNRNLDPKDTFKSGNEYSFHFALEADYGYIFAENAAIYLNDHYANVDFEHSYRNPTEHNQFYVATYPIYAVTNIDLINVNNIARPKIGKKAADCLKLTIPAGSHYSLNESFWYDQKTGTPMEPGDVFQAGHLYSLCIRVQADPGYSFPMLAIPNLNGFEIPVNEYNSGRFEAYHDIYEIWTYLFDPSSYYCGGTPNSCPGAGFVDMPKFSNWAHEGIDFCVANGLMSGVTPTTFAPQTNMSRAMLVTVIYRMEGEPGAGKATFTDVKATSWYGPAVSWAADKGIVTGTGNGTFNPNGNVTREQIAAIFYRYAQYKGYDILPSADIDEYPDASKVGSYAVPSMQWAVATGLITGNSVNGKTILDPKGKATRAQVATMLMRLVAYVSPKG